MSSQPLNPNSRDVVTAAFTSAPSTHPDYIYWAPHWETIRDSEIGEIEIKRKREKYLPKLAGHNSTQYDAYLHRAVFFNMTAKTLNALYGTVFKRAPKVSGLTKSLRESSKHFSKDGMSLHLTAKTAVKEVLAVARYGMLVDSDASGAGDAYVACYTTENIMDWEVGSVDGRQQYTRVVLREISYDRSSNNISTFQYVTNYRVLVLTPTADGHVYEQHIYNDADSTTAPDAALVPTEIIVPTVRGNTLDYIPFIAIGPFTNQPNIQKPPIMDIISLNLSHYSSYAQLEHGRFYTANPVYYARTDSTEDVDYFVGPDTVWLMGKDDNAGIIEFAGQGLKFLENALDTKETQIAAIGGRMMPGTSAAAAESDNSLKLKEQNEQTLLLNISDTVDEAITQVVVWWADWNNATASVMLNIQFELNRDFLLKDIGAREFRAIHQMYDDGIIPVDVVYDYLRKADVIPEWMDAAEYKKLLVDSKQFPHMVDVLAQMQGYPDAKSFQEFKMARMAFNATATTAASNSGDPDVPPVPRQAEDAGRLAKIKRGAAED